MDLIQVPSKVPVLCVNINCTFFILHSIAPPPTTHLNTLLVELRTSGQVLPRGRVRVVRARERRLQTHELPLAENRPVPPLSLSVCLVREGRIL